MAKSKSEKIRQYAADNPDAKPKDIAEALGHGFKAQYVSTILNKDKSGGKVKTRRSTVPSVVVDDVFTAMAIVNKADEQDVTLKQFVDSLQIGWSVLEGITSMKELKELKERKGYGAFVERYGKANALKLLENVKKKMS